MEKSSDARRAHLVIPESLIEEIDSLVGPRGRSQFIVEAARYELKRQRQLGALKAAAGAWDADEHPELREGGLSYQKKLRAESDRRGG